MPTGQNDIGRNAFGLSPSEVVPYFYHWLHVTVVMINRVEQKKFLLSSVTHVPSGLMGFALAA